MVTDRRAASAAQKADLDAAAAQRLSGWLRDYRPLAGIPDELLDATGRPRDHWLNFLGHFAEYPDQEFRSRFSLATRHIRDTGVSYRIYGEETERTWPLSPLPLILTEADWSQIVEGVEQRANLMEAILRDIYGQGALVANGALPAAALTGSPDFLRAMQGVKPPGDRYLQLYAADLGRGPDGRWWVLDDRAQAPSGAGYALENRLVLSRAFPNLYNAMNVQRLAGFFDDLRKGLAATAGRADPRICLLTPGPYSETYFEQAHLARYLGLLLVEGEDLVVRQGKVYVRTIEGLKRADVILRRVDADFIDPLELNSASHLGTPGMMDAVRAGGVAVVNMPGSGVIESKALLGFIDPLCQRLFREDLKLPNIATWWCGQKAAREAVLERLDEMAITGAFGESVPGFPGKRILLGADLGAEDKARLRGLIEARGVDYVGQEIVRLSTTPVWENGKLTPRPFVLRVYAAATPDGWRVMPGGFCRISGQPDARAVSMGEGVTSADVWVLADKPVEMASLLPTDANVKIRRLLGNLPSRAADNLFWLGRYLERVEATLRIVRCLCNRIVDSDPGVAPAQQSVTRLQRLLVAWGAASEDVVGASPATAAVEALYADKQYGSARSLARDSARAASVIRERLSTDTWQLVQGLEAQLSAPAPAGLSEPECFDHADSALRALAALSGLIQENVNRVAGWRFLDIGRRIERGVNTCRFARHFADANATADNLDVLLELIDSQITFRSRYLIGVALAPVRDMAMLDTFNPRSVAFQVERIDEHLATLPVLREDGMIEAPKRIAVRLVSELATGEAMKFDAARMFGVEQQLMELGNAIAERYFLQGPQAGRVDKLRDLA